MGNRFVLEAWFGVVRCDDALLVCVLLPLT